MESALPRHHILRQNGVRRVPQDTELPKSMMVLPTIGDRSRTLSKSKSGSGQPEEKQTRSVSRQRTKAKDTSQVVCAEPGDSNAFKLLFPVGVGSFGKVWKATHIASGASYAIKKLSKVQIVRKASAESVLIEKKLLELLKNE